MTHRSVNMKAFLETTEEVAAVGNPSGLAWDSTPHPTPGPSVLDKTVTVWRGSQRLEPQQAGRVGETLFSAPSANTVLREDRTVCWGCLGS